MADSKYNETGLPTTVIPPPSGQPQNPIGWRQMIVNWFGSMFFIGLCSPLMVWLVVYFIRTRGQRGKKSKEEQTSDSVIKDQIKREIRPLDGPMAAAESTRIKQKMSKRDHFCRYLGWWSTSAAEPPRANRLGSDDEPRARFKPRYPQEHRPWLMHGNAHISLQNLAERGELKPFMPSIQEVITPKEEKPRSVGQVTKSTGVDVNTTDGNQEVQSQDSDEPYLMSGALGSDETDNNTVRKRTVGRGKVSQWEDLSQELSQTANNRLLIFDHTPDSVVDSNIQSPDLDFRQHEEETTLAVTPPIKHTQDLSRILSGPKIRKVFSTPTLRSTGSLAAQSTHYVKPVPVQLNQASAPIMLYHYRDRFGGSIADPALKESTNYQIPTIRIESPSDATSQSSSGKALKTVAPKKTSKLPSEPHGKKPKKFPSKECSSSHQSFSIDQTRRSALDIPRYFKEWNKLNNLDHGCKEDKREENKTFENEPIDTHTLDEYECEHSILDAEAMTGEYMSIDSEGSLASTSSAHVTAEGQNVISAQETDLSNEQDGARRMSRSTSPDRSMLELQIRVYSRPNV